MPSHPEHRFESPLKCRAAVFHPFTLALSLTRTHASGFRQYVLRVWECLPAFAGAKRLECVRFIATLAWAMQYGGVGPATGAEIGDKSHALQTLARPLELGATTRRETPTSASEAWPP